MALPGAVHWLGGGGGAKYPPFLKSDTYPRLMRLGRVITCIRKYRYRFHFNGYILDLLAFSWVLKGYFRKRGWIFDDVNKIEYSKPYHDKDILK